jgi:hypothetical protein
VRATLLVPRGQEGAFSRHGVRRTDEVQPLRVPQSTARL